ncbi:hypothetical protein ACC678_37645, partial [Rhizobium ruizarguesonis]
AVQADTKPQQTAESGSEQQTAAPTSQSLIAQTHMMKLQENGALAVNGRRWSFDVLPDKAPELAFAGLPKPSVNGAL